MSKERELLELAAKAAGYKLEWDDKEARIPVAVGPDVYSYWNPLTDDGDALRLAVKLNLNVVPIARHFLNVEGDPPMTKVFWGGFSDRTHCWEPHKNDPYAATRRAIVRAAAEIGRGME